jgi:hypothetical protein
MACRPGHPFFALLLERLASYASNARDSAWNMNILNSTGPVFVSEVLVEYAQRYNTSDKGLIHIAPSSLFMPTFDSALTATFRVKCLSANLSREQQHVCSDLRRRDFSNVPSSRAITDHHWIHSWADRFVPRGFKTIDSLVDDVQFDLPVGDENS